MADSSVTPRRCRIASAIESRPTAAFFALALAISWSVWIPLFVAIPSATSAVMVPGAFGPAIAAVTVLWIQGKSIREWLVNGLDWHIPKHWYVIVLGLPLALGVILGIGLAIITGRFTTDRLVQAAATYPIMMLTLSVIGGGQEELGWRGFALPTLQNQSDALTSSIIIGLVWAVWHLPAFVFEIPGYTHSFVLYTLLVVGISILLTWLYNSTEGSILLAMVLHGGVNAAPNLGMVFVGNSPPDSISPYLILVPIVWGVALLLLYQYGRDTLSTGSVLTNTTQNSRTRASKVSP